MTFFLTAVFILLVFWRPQEWLWPWLYGFPLLPVIFGLSLFSLFIEIKERRLRIPEVKPPQYLLVWGLFFAALMSHIAWGYFEGVMFTIEPFLRLAVFTTLVIAVLDRPSRLRWIARIVVVMACLMAVHCLLQESRGYGFAYNRPLYIRAIRGAPAYTRSRFFGIFEDPNDTAQILAVGIPFAFVLFKRRNFFAFLIGCLATALLVAGFLTTHSRGGLIAMISVGTIMLALLLPERLVPWVLLAMAVGGLLATPLSSVWLETTPYTYARIDFWAQANWAFKSRPIFGVGYRILGDYIRGRAAHNAFVHAYAELGLFGYWFWFNLILLGVMGAWRVRVALARPLDDEQAYVKKFAGMALAAMVGFATSSYFLSRAFIFPMFILMAILAPLPSLAQQLLPENYPPLMQPRRDALLWGTIGSIVSIFYVYFSILLVNRIYFG